MSCLYRSNDDIWTFAGISVITAFAAVAVGFTVAIIASAVDDGNYGLDSEKAGYEFGITTEADPRYCATALGDDANVDWDEEFWLKGCMKAAEENDGQR